MIGSERNPIPEAWRNHDMSAIVRSILDGYSLPLFGYHGVVHWARVLKNGLHIAAQNGADEEVVALFALFHDGRRFNESKDRDHGLRGAEFARSLRGTLVHLNNSQFDALFEACRLHTEGLTTQDVTLQACWDADRLDLGRVGITPDLNRLCSDAARALVSSAHERAVNGYVPDEILSLWGLSDSQAVLPPLMP